jgi:signal peptidase I
MTKDRRAKRKENAATQHDTPGFLGGMRAFIVGLLPAFALVVVAEVAIAQPFRIPSGSMEPTLLPGDWLVVNKLRYGPHIPFTSVNLPGYSTVKRGDVAVFESPVQDPSIRMSPDDSTPTLVKRVVGVGGDTLVMRRGRLFVNGVAESRAVADTTESAVHDWGPLVVPANAFFMMGDNRDDSVDSRFYGVVPRGNVRGSPMFIYYSYDTEGGLDWFRAVTEIRWRRLGSWIR